MDAVTLGLAQADAKRRYSPVFGAQGYDERVAPSFTRVTNNPIFTAANQNPASGKTAAASIYWPCVLRADVIPGVTPIDKWYMYYSTDHAGDAGGIWLATAPTALGPWTSQGRVFVSGLGSTLQTENAQIVYDDDTALFRMYYKTFVSTIMAIGMATSPDGITWTDKGVILTYPTATNPYISNGQTGYMKPFRIGRQWHAHLAIGGGNVPTWALAHSDDGIKWIVEGKPMMYGTDQLVDFPGATTPLGKNAIRVEWNSGNVLWWRGQYWWIGMVSSFASGGGAANTRMVAAPIAGNLRALLGRPTYLLAPPTGASESYNYRSVHAHVVGGRILLTYQCDSSFNLAVGN